MSSLRDLLSKEVKEHDKSSKTTRKAVKFRERAKSEDSVVLPIYICHDGKGCDYLMLKGDKTIRRQRSLRFSSRRLSSDSKKPNSNSVAFPSSRKDEPAIDEAAIKAVISILGGYVGRYLTDASFREFIKEKCKTCVVRKKEEIDRGMFTNMELGIQSVEKLVESQGSSQELKKKTLQNSIQLLSIVASLNSDSKKTKNGSSCGKMNWHVSACAQFYLAIVNKIEKNDWISARHLLQVFCDSPFLARTHLLPDLWEHLFLPHLLHLKVWYENELEFLSSRNDIYTEKKVKALSKVYNKQMDMGTIQFAQYYKEWLKEGANAPALPTVPLPSKPSCLLPRKSSDSYIPQSSRNRSLYSAVFGPNEDKKLTDFGDQSKGLIGRQGLGEGEKVCSGEEDKYKLCNYGHNGNTPCRRSLKFNHSDPKSELWPEEQKPDYLQLNSCQTVIERSVNGRCASGINFIKNEEQEYVISYDLSAAVATVSSSDSLIECEIAVRLITKAWLDSHGEKIIGNTLSQAPVIEGLLEVMFASDDDEVLELVVSILAELMARHDMIGQMILNLDPQLEIFLRLLRSSTLFLKSAILLYLLKPEAKQMIATEWLPLVLRVLEFGDHLQTLFTVKCSPKEAAFYLLDQLLKGFDEGRNLENARQVVSHGGLSLLVKLIEVGDIQERYTAASMISICIRADGSCRCYLTDNLNQTSLLELIVLENQNSLGCGFALLIELLCLDRKTRIRNFLGDLKNGWDGIDTMHILFVYLQKVSVEDRPLVAVILLLLDMLGGTMRCSVYREEAVDVIVESLDCEKCSDNIQAQSAKALLILGGCFSCTGEASTEQWILNQAGFSGSSSFSSIGKEIVLSDSMQLSEYEEAEDWQQKLATVLLHSGNKRLLAAISDSAANGIPVLARASLITISWISRYLPSVGNQNLQSMACSVLTPQILESLKYNKYLEEQVLASYTLLNLIKISESMIPSPDKELISHLQNLSLVTWTARELIAILKSSSRHQSRMARDMYS